MCAGKVNKVVLESRWLYGPDSSTFPHRGSPLSSVLHACPIPHRNEGNRICHFVCMELQSGSSKTV